MKYTLGIDIGTSKVAVVVFDNATREIAALATEETRADLSAPPTHAEQDPAKIFEVVDRAVAALDSSMRARVEGIGVTGQMHGVVLWSSKSGISSPLVTWQDRRCLAQGFLDDLRIQTSDQSINTGFGCATLAWFAKRDPAFFDQFDSASTIHDFFVSRICGLERAVTDETDAASWGFYDFRARMWDDTKVRRAGIPREVMPNIRPPGTRAGTLSTEISSRWGVPTGTPVTVAIGDNQASLLSTIEHPKTDIALTLGTGGQLAVVVDDFERYAASLSLTAEIRPYLDGKFIVVGASLCGGSAMKWLMLSLQSWIKDLGLPEQDVDSLYQRVETLALEAPGSSLSVHPHFLGERSNPEARGAITGIDDQNFTVGNLAQALSSGVVHNLRSMLPSEVFRGRKRVVGSGNGIRRSRLIQRAVEDIFAFPLVLSSLKEEAACGAAILAGRD